MSIGRKQLSSSHCKDSWQEEKQFSQGQEGEESFQVITEEQPLCSNHWQSLKEEGYVGIKVQSIIWKCRKKGLFHICCVAQASFISCKCQGNLSFLVTAQSISFGRQMFNTSFDIEVNQIQTTLA